MTKMNIVQTKEELEELATNGNIVLIDFYTEWCGPCRAIAPWFKEISELPEYKSVVFVKVDGDQADELLDFFEIQGFPTFIIVKGAELTILEKFLGANTQKIMERLNTFLQPDSSEDIMSDNNVCGNFL
jgi:thioredoxin 1